MKPERKEELCKAVSKALIAKKATYAELWELLGENLFWCLKYGRYEHIKLYELPEEQKV